MFARIAVDVHLHFYESYDQERFWQSLCDNLAFGAAERFCENIQLQKMVLLTEASGCNMFSRWAVPGASAPGGFTFSPTDEPYSLALNRRGERLVLIVSGRQIVTAERLEVLTAGVFPAIPDGWPLPEVAAGLAEAGALAIIPWGAGKWLGRRGHLVKRIAASNTDPTLFLADNPARPVFWPAPRIFCTMESRGKAVLRGSDPLPLPGEEKRAGAFASLLEGDFDPMRPLSSLKKILAQNGRVQGFGRRDGMVTFFRRQIGLRLRG
ncbi:MAG: hypothetical protein ABII93_00050 [Chrysiogenia bacterium]